ncbi:MAG: acyl carrier protein [Firmicutes bacterium]|nr:acyl carrier protein [Bacillota bacterium]
MSILDRIQKIIEDETGIEAEVTMESTFEDLELDSLDLVELTVACEDEFGIELALDTVPKNVGELVEMIAEMTGEEE